MPLSVQQLVNRLTFRQLQVFLSVYQLKSYSRAGEYLGLTQPAISSQVRHLEAALGVPVFEYVGRQLYCTAAGEKLAASIDIIFEELRSLQSSLGALEGQVAGELKLVAVNTAQYVAPYLLKGFLALHPALNISLRVVGRVEALESLRRNIDHLAIMGILPAEKSLSALPFLDNEFVAVTRPDHPLQARESLTIHEFLNAGLLSREAGSGSRIALESYCQQNRLSLTPKMELGSNDAIKHAVLAGLGVAILPRMSVLPELKLGMLSLARIDQFALKRSWCVVHEKAKHPTPAMQAFLDYVQTHLNALAQTYAALMENET